MPSFIDVRFSDILYSVFTSDTLACDCALKRLIEWKETVQRWRELTLQGICFSPGNLKGRSIGDLSPEEIPCGKWNFVVGVSISFYGANQCNISLMLNN